MDLINCLYHNRVRDPLSWNVLAASQASVGFCIWTGLCYQQPDPIKLIPVDWEKQQETAMKMRFECYIQQMDGMCKAFRGFKWARTIDIREICEVQEIPCTDQHKSYVPYTTQEIQEFKKCDFSGLLRRCCPESRWDWLFPLGPILNVGLRLRHLTHLQELGVYVVSCMKVYLKLKIKYAKQDLVAWRFISSARKTGNDDVAQKRDKINLEHRGCQVETHLSGVRQVKLTKKNPKQVRSTRKLLPSIEELKVRLRECLEQERSGNRRLRTNKGMQRGQY